jgi:hypothetical protein
MKAPVVQEPKGESPAPKNAAAKFKIFPQQPINTLRRFQKVIEKLAGFPRVRRSQAKKAVP